MTTHAFIEIEGHIFDSHLFEKILESIREKGADYRIIEVHSGRSAEDPSRARIEVSAPSASVLEEAIVATELHGTKRLTMDQVDPSILEEAAVPEEATPLQWGRRYAMCEPRFFHVAYEINPWMHSEVRVDHDKANEQWRSLVAAIEEAGATVERLDPIDGQPDYVFTANAGLIDGDTFIPASFRHPQRQGETPHATAWFRSRGYQIAPLPTGLVHEGAGDALPFNDVLLSGYRIRSDAPSHAAVARLTRSNVRAVELVDPRLYHLDLTFCPLDSRRAIVAPMAWDEHGQRVVRALVPEPLVLETEEALDFVANSVVIDSTILMPSCPSRVEKQLRKWGFEVVVIDVSEFLKAGGACRCLTLSLDVTFGSDRSDR